MPISDRIDGLTVETDERGFLLHLSGYDAEYAFRLDDPAEFLKILNAEIGPWIAEMELARATLPARWTDEEIEAYEQSDPKRPEFHSTHVDLYDVLREGK